MLIARWHVHASSASTVLPQNQGIDIGRADAEAASQVKSEPQAVEICPGAEDPLMPQQAHCIGQRIDGSVTTSTSVCGAAA